ncbi:MAG: tetratricopeptide repeat protein [Candidatus Zixiibacteriota bacterium]
MKKTDEKKSIPHPNDAPSLQTKSVLFFAVLFLVAFIPRLVHLLSIANNPFFHFPIIDAQTYDDWAQAIAKGHWIGDKVFWQAPLYPYFLAIIYRIFGHDLFLARLIQLLLGSVNCLLLYKVARAVFNSKVALIVFLIASFYGPFIFFEAELLNPVLVIFLSLSLILVLLSFDRQPKTIKLLAAGVILGLSSITHGLTLIFLPFAILWTVVVLWKKQVATRKIVNYSLCLLIGFLLVIFSTTIRNWLVGKELVLVSSNTGINFYVGNNPDYDRTTSIRPGIEWEELIQGPMREGMMKSSERSAFFWKQALSYMTGQPISYLRLLFKKFLLILDGYEIKRNQDMYMFRSFSPVLSVLLWKGLIYFPFGILLPLSLIGMIIFWRDRHNSKSKALEPILILYFILSQVIALLLFFVCDRYRLPLVPFLIAFAGYALYRLYEILKTKKSKDIVALLALFLIFALVSNISRHEPTAKDQAEEHYNLGTVYGRQQKADQAVEEYEKALSYQPDHLMTHFNLAFLYQQHQKTQEAIDEYQQVIKLFPDAALAYNNLGQIYEQKGDRQTAEQLYLKASELHPLLPDPLYNLGNVYSTEGKYAESKDRFEACIKVDPAYYKAYNGLGDYYYRTGETDQAIEFFHKALRIRPDYEVAHSNLGTAYIQKGDRQAAFSEFSRASQINPNYGPAHLNLGNYYLEQRDLQKAIGEYERAKELLPRDPRVHYHLAVAYVMSGFQEDAIAELNTALSFDSSFVQAKELLERIKK